MGSDSEHYTDGTDDTRPSSMNSESNEETAVESDEEMEVEPDEAEPQVEVGSSSRLRNGITLGEQILRY